MKTNIESDNFKVCPNCAQSWTNRDEFLNDPQTKLIGYQAHFNELEAGLFLFNHLSCKSTISIKSERFRSLYDGPVFTKKMMDDGSCPNYCLSKYRLEPCSNECECAFVREIIQVINNWEKSGPLEDSDHLEIW